MRPVLAPLLLLCACGPELPDTCVQVQWEVVLDDGSWPTDVAVRGDGTVGVLAGGTLLEFDPHGMRGAEHRLQAADGSALQGRRLHADAQGRWWVTATGSRITDGPNIDTLVRIDPDGTLQTKQLPPQGKISLGPIIGWGDHIVVGGGDLSDEHQPPPQPTPDGLPPFVFPVATVLEVDGDMNVANAWTSSPELAWVSYLLDVGGELLVVATPPSIDWANGELMRLDGYDDPAAWSRTVDLIGASDGIEDITSSERHALLLTDTREIVDPDAVGEYPPVTRARTSVQAWDVEGELAWTHDLTTGPGATGKIAASEHTVLAWVSEDSAAADLHADLFALDHEGTGVCTQTTTPGQAVLLEAAPAWGPNTFVSLARAVGDDPLPRFRLSRLRVAR